VECSSFWKKVIAFDEILFVLDFYDLFLLGVVRVAFCYEFEEIVGLISGTSCFDLVVIDYK